MKKLFCASLLFVPIHAHAETPRFHTDPSCWDQARYFHSTEENAETLSKITLSRFTTSGDENESRKWIPSANGGFRFTTAQARSGRSDTNALLVFVERPYLLELRVAEAGAISELRWINEKLIFLRIWWGRVRASDIILDVEREQIRLADVLEDGERAYQQFREGCRQPDAKCKCSVADAYAETPHNQTN